MSSMTVLVLQKGDYNAASGDIQEMASDGV